MPGGLSMPFCCLPAFCHTHTHTHTHTPYRPSRYSNTKQPINQPSPPPARSWFISIAFELCEKTLQHWLPNFNECWWDSWLLDVAICNAIGIYTGTWWGGKGRATGWALQATFCRLPCGDVNNRALRVAASAVSR